MEKCVVGVMKDKEVLDRFDKKGLYAVLHMERNFRLPGKEHQKFQGELVQRLREYDDRIEREYKKWWNRKSVGYLKYKHNKQFGEIGTLQRICFSIDDYRPLLSEINASHFMKKEGSERVEPPK